jgi:tight adherence protein B
MAAVLGVVLVGPRTALVGGILGLVLVYAWIRRRASKRCAAFGAQLPDILQLMSGGLRAGYGLMQALDSVAQSMPAPAGTEFRRAKTEVQLGKDTETALRDMAVRVDSEDFRWVVDAIEIHRQVGGNLGDILDAVAETIRDRQKIKRRVKGLAAEGRISAYVLGALPLVVAGGVSLLNPGYFADLTGTMVGQALIGGCLVLMSIGILWMKKITAIKF